MMHVVYVRGGCIDLVGCPWWGKIEWLKSLNISEGMFRIFNSSMVFVLDGAHVHTLYVVYVQEMGNCFENKSLLTFCDLKSLIFLYMS